jgi:hypothetical protein
MTDTFSARALRHVRRYVPILAWVLVTASLLLIPVRIIGYGYIPADDARRHVAKAVANRPWDDILVLRDGITIDHNAGWHAILAGLHDAFQWPPDALIAFSICALFLAFAFAPLPAFRRPEAWAAALLIINLTDAAPIFRLTLGRPLILAMAATIALFALWRRPSATWFEGKRWIPTVGLFAFAVWIHGSWYLFLLPIAAFVLARRLRDASQIASAWLAGSFLGAALTGAPIRFLWEHVQIVLRSFGHHDAARLLVSEFQPQTGYLSILMTIVLLLIIRRVGRRSLASLWHDPVWMMMLIGWMLSFRVGRFYLDWGLPATILWIGWEVQGLIEEHSDPESPRRAAATAFLCAALFLSCTSDWQSRWTGNLTEEHLSPDVEEHVAWLPGEGGVVYSDDMRVFYTTFYANPRAPWRYILGYEPTFMPPADLAVYRRIQWNRGDPRTYAPWIEKMRPEDRLILSRAAGNPPEIPALEWNYTASKTWIGRLPSRRDEAEPRP